MATKKTKRPAKASTAKTTASFDGVFLFKMVFYLLIGSLWLKVTNGHSITVSVPIGLIVGIIFTTHEHFRIDRKLEYAVLLVAMLVGYFASYGLYINF